MLVPTTTTWLAGSTPVKISMPQRVGNYEILQQLGSGMFSTVQLARHTTLGTEVAVKVIHLRNLRQHQQQQVENEILNMQRVRHPNIIQLYEVCEQDGVVYLFMEYAPHGNLRSYLSKRGKLDETHARLLFIQLLSALYHCHSRQVVHRDLKLENILLDADDNLKVADFGFSVLYDDSTLLSTYCGSPPYTAPEVFLGIPYRGPEVDVWSLGVILYTMVVQSFPFEGDSFEDIRSRVIAGQFHLPKHLSADLCDLLSRLLSCNVVDRRSIDDFFSHPWLNADLQELLHATPGMPAFGDYSTLGGLASHLPLDISNSLSDEAAPYNIYTSANLARMDGLFPLTRALGNSDSSLATVSLDFDEPSTTTNAAPFIIDYPAHCYSIASQASEAPVFPSIGIHLSQAQAEGYMLDQWEERFQRKQVKTVYDQPTNSNPMTALDRLLSQNSSNSQVASRLESYLGACRRIMQTRK